jgi:MFS family permease
VTTRAEADRAGFAVAPGVLLAGVAGGLAFPILPAIGLERGLPAFVIGAILAANRLSRIVAGPFVGTLADRSGARRMLLWGLFGQVGVMLLYLLAVTTPYTALCFFLGRLLHGPCAAAVFVAGQALALRSGGREHGGLAAGTVKAAMAVGLPLGVLLGSLLHDRLGAVGLFESSIAALLMATAFASRFVPDLPVVARRTPPFALLQNSRVAALGALNFAVTFSALGVVLTALPLLNRHAATLPMGLLVLSMGAGTFLSARFGAFPVLSAAVLPFGLLTLGLIGHPLIGAVATGLAAGVLSASVTTQLNAAVAPEQVGAASGWLQLCGDLGGVAGPLLASALLSQGAPLLWLGSAAVLLMFIPVALWLHDTR